MDTKAKGGERETMPSTYAHKRFGEKVLEALPEALSGRLRRHLPEYFLGLHGPDLLFYYRPLGKNDVNRKGYRMHERPGTEFFAPSREIVLKAAERSGEAPPETAEGAYIAGFICHFALDSECHGYIGERIAATGIRHAVIETEFDRALLAADGQKVLGVNHAAHLARPETAKTAAEFLGVTREQAQKSLAFFVKANGWFTSENPLFRATVFFLLAVGRHREIRGMFYDKTPRADCAPSNAALTEKFYAAIPVAASLVSSYFENLTAPALCERFGYDYEGNRPAPGGATRPPEKFLQ